MLQLKWVQAQRHGAVINTCHSASLQFETFSMFLRALDSGGWWFFNWWTFRLLTRLKHKGAAASYWSVSQQFSIWHLWNASKSKLPPNFSDISQEPSQYQKYFYRGLRRAFVFCQTVKTHYTQVPKEAMPSTGIILNYYSPNQLGDH